MLFLSIFRLNNAEVKEAIQSFSRTKGNVAEEKEAGGNTNGKVHVYNT